MENKIENEIENKSKTKHLGEPWEHTISVFTQGSPRCAFSRENAGGTLGGGDICVLRNLFIMKSWNP